MELRLSYFNYEHGGRRDADYTGNGGEFDFSGLVRVMSHGDDWPDIAVVGEGDRYELNGREGAWEACAAMSEAGGPSYVPHTCCVPREGLFAPVIFTRADTIAVRRFYDHRLPDHGPRVQNLLEFTPRLPRGRKGELMRALTGHGDIHSGDARLADARTLDRYANPAIPAAVLQDWNAVPSGPMWEPTDLNTPGVHNPRQLAWRKLFRHGPAQAGPHVYDSRALDYLIGYWHAPRDWRRAWLRHPGRRVGGIGWYDAAELAQDFTPTQTAKPNGRQPLAIDRILLNEPFAEAMVPGSYRVHPFPDPNRPDSDHHRVSVTVDL